MAPQAPPPVSSLDDLAKRARSVTAQGLISQAPSATGPGMPMPMGMPSVPTGPAMGGAAPPQWTAGAQMADQQAIGAGIKPGSLKGAPGVVKLAATAIGTPYVFGAEMGPSGVDCSGFTKWAYSRMGAELPHSAQGQMQSTTPVSQDQLKPGMLVYFNFGRLSPGVADHVMIYAGHGRAIGAQPSTGGVGWYDNVFSMPEVIGYGAVQGVNYGGQTSQRRTSAPAPHAPSHAPSPSPHSAPKPSPQAAALRQKQQTTIGRRI